VAFNADLDNGQTIDGESALSAISRAHSPNTVPVSGTVIYAPPRDYQSDAETVVLTLDSNSDGVISSSDRGDEAEEPDVNRILRTQARDVRVRRFERERGAELEPRRRPRARSLRQRELPAAALRVRVRSRPGPRDSAQDLGRQLEQRAPGVVSASLSAMRRCSPSSGR
jgi:hypothetical protein